MKKITAILFSLLLVLPLALGSYAAPLTEKGEVSIPKATAKPTLDGSITEAEWGESLMYSDSETPISAGAGATGTAAVKADYYMLWDNDGLYLAAKVKDTVHANNREGKDLWQGDGFVFGISYTVGNVDKRNSFILALSNLSGQYAGVAYQDKADHFGTVGDISSGTQFKIARDDSAGYTYYELFLTWEQLGTTDAKFSVAEGGQFSTRMGCFVTNDDNTKAASQWCNLSGTFTLAAAAASSDTTASNTTAGSDTTKAPENTTAPATSDQLFIPAILFTFTFALVFISFIIRKNKRVNSAKSV